MSQKTPRGSLCVCSACSAEVFVGGESVGSLWSCVGQQEEHTPTEKRRSKKDTTVAQMHTFGL